MSKQIIIDPITRISGFLSIEAVVDKQKVIDAKSESLLFRGFEAMLKERNPRDAVYFTERICGICSTAHAMASTVALENAMNISVNKNAIILRNIMHGCEFLQNHIRHFYLYVIPDYVPLPQLENLGTGEIHDFRLPAHINEKISNNYNKAIKYSRMAHEVLALFGGKAPHCHGILPGGVTSEVTIEKLIKAKSNIKEIKQFIEDNMIIDAEAIGAYYSEYYNIGVGCKNFLTYGIPGYVEAQVLINNKKEKMDYRYITESIGQNSWCKTPRYKGEVIEVGPLARMYISGIYTKGISVIDRIKARVLEAYKICNMIQNMLNELEISFENIIRADIPQVASGIGLVDTTRGALLHYVEIENSKIKNYNIITPSTWNLSPKDDNGKNGALEVALIGTEVKSLECPVEIGRVVRSFDPCVSCATHVINGEKINSIR